MTCSKIKIGGEETSKFLQIIILKINAPRHFYQKYKGYKKMSLREMIEICSNYIYNYGYIMEAKHKSFEGPMNRS